MFPTCSRRTTKQLVSALGEQTKVIRSTAALVVAKIAIIEIPQGKWPEIINQLNANTKQNNAPLTQSSLETLGYICEELPDGLEDKSPIILETIAIGMGSATRTLT